MDPRVSSALCMALCVCYLSGLVMPVCGADQPHIVMILADDLGWSGVGYQAADEAKDEVLTPNIDKLATEDGVRFSRMYAYHKCAPSRGSFQSGRLPVHVNLEMIFIDYSNPDDEVSGYAGIPRNMTGLATKLTDVGYTAHMVGKWDCGGATHEHTPVGRGYNSSLGYFGHYIDYWSWEYNDTHCGQVFTDCWQDNAPCPQDLTTISHSEEELLKIETNIQAKKEEYYADEDDDVMTKILKDVSGELEDYVEYKLYNRASEIIKEHDPDTPLFLNYNMHVPHVPLQIPQSYWENFEYIDNDFTGRFHRRIYTAMLNIMDMYVGKIVDDLKDAGLWENTLFIFQSDNGGSTFTRGTDDLDEHEEGFLEDDWYQANNYPLRGGKTFAFEGGVRVVAFMAGGYLEAEAPDRIGTELDGIVHIVDWHAVFCRLAGADINDYTGELAGLPGIDAIDVWDYMLGVDDASPRQEYHIDADALIVGNYKIMLHTHSGNCLHEPVWPNMNDPCVSDSESENQALDCGTTGCLFDVVGDTTESQDLADDPDYALVLQYMRARLEHLNEFIFDPERGDANEMAWWYAENKYNNHWGPFLYIED